MKHIAIFAIAAIISTSALAEDYDNTAVKFTAQTESFHISIAEPKTGASSFAIGSSSIAPVDLEATWMRNGDVDNYSVNAGKSMNLPLAGLYAGADAKLTFGDSFTTETRTLALTPHVGAKGNVMGVSPYAELGLSWQATSNEWANFDRSRSYIELGASYAITNALDFKVSITEPRDMNFTDAGERQAQVGFTVKF